MKRIKKRIGKILVLICACLTIGTVVNAADKASTDVDITIEADMTKQNDTHVAKTNGTDETDVVGQKQKIQTGDSSEWIKYIVALGAALIVVVGCIRKKRKGMLAVFALAFTMLLANDSVLAADIPENVNVTIPTNISISFDESGNNSISKFDINNQSLVPITIEKIHVTECNDWQLSTKGQEIPVDTKSLVFVIEEQALLAGDNPVNIAIEEQSSEVMDIQVERGAWTTSRAKETAFQLEFEYEIGKKQFELKFDSNGGGEAIAARKVYNGDTVELPTPKRDGYAFKGWEDGTGKIYTNQFVMPIGDVTLKAMWKETVAYAIYSATDTSLRFVRTADTIRVGDTYNGRVVTGLYTGFEEAVYTSENQVPWYDGNYYDTRIVTKIIFEDVIKPKSTAHWFQYAYDCTELDVRKLDTSQVTNMEYMFQCFAWDAKTINVTGMSEWDVSKVTSMEWMFGGFGFNTPTIKLDLSKWNVSKVTTMKYMFYQMGQWSSTFSLGDLSGWNVSSAKNLSSMFYLTGVRATWSLNLSRWNVKNVTSHTSFCTQNESRITQPKWVN